MCMQRQIFSNKLSVLTTVTDCDIVGNITGISIGKLTCDSRKVERSDLFCCVNGTFDDGHAYAQKACEMGAAAILCEHVIENIKVPQIVVKDTRRAMALMAAEYYNHPAEGMVIIGVTGTNGKTSTTYMIKSIAEKAGKKVGIIGTVQTMIGDMELPAERTTPDSIELQRLFRSMKDASVDIVVMEVSSHALDQDRVYGVLFDVAEFTNLTQDHLDYHKTFEAYLDAKKKLFGTCIKAVVNTDDPYSGAIMNDITCPTVSFGIELGADMRAVNIDDSSPVGVAFTLQYGRETVDISLPIPGRFTVMNALGAACVAYSADFTWEQIKAGLESMQTVPGRLQPLPTYGRDFGVYLDYAHTPDAIVNVLNAARHFTRGRLITLFGCGGDRDRTKRPIMGEEAGKLSDLLIVTSDNPRTEDPAAIISEIIPGVIKSGCEYKIVESRIEAIEYALSIASSGDVIVLAGKGHETYQEIDGVKHHLDEKEIVDALLRR